jgi:hypothetical protein
VPTISPASARNAIFERFARRTGHHIIAVCKETASGAKIDRVQRKKVMALAQAREIDVILVMELDLVCSMTSTRAATCDHEVYCRSRGGARNHAWVPTTFINLTADSLQNRRNDRYASVTDATSPATNYALQLVR